MERLLIVIGIALVFVTLTWLGRTVEDECEDETGEHSNG